MFPPCFMSLNPFDCEEEQKMSSSIRIAETSSGPAYKIVIENDFSQLEKELAELEVKGRKGCIVTDRNVGPVYAKELEAVLGKVFSKIVTVEIEAGEEYKNLETVKEVYRRLIENHFDRGLLHSLFTKDLGVCFYFVWI